jgi:hypothetical protein
MQDPKMTYNVESTYITTRMHGNVMFMSLYVHLYSFTIKSMFNIRLFLYDSYRNNLIMRV